VCVTLFRMGRGESELVAVAADQRHLITRADALGAGVSNSAIKRKLVTGRLVKRQAGVYQVDWRPQDWRDQLLTAVLAAGSASLVSHRAALVLWQLDGISLAPVEITAPYENKPIPKHVIIHRTRRPMERAIVDDIPVTNPERTLLDCCSVLPTVVVAKALESAIRMRLTTEDRIHDTLVEKGGRGVRGTKTMRWILSERISNTATGSGSETELLYHLQAAFLPRPVLQHVFFSADGQKMMPDFYWPDLGKAVEVDGLDAHDSADKLDNDLKRQNALMNLGVELRRFSAREVRRNPEGVVAQIRQFLEGGTVL
jgi:hypothetical protein